MWQVPVFIAAQCFSVSDENIKLQDGRIDLYDKNGEYSDYEFSADELEEIYRAFLADVEEGNFKENIYNKYRYDDSWDQMTYFNSINIDYISKDKKENADVDGYGYTNMTASVVYNAYIQFDVNCKNIIAALVKTGVIDSEEDLITIDEKNKLDEKNMGYVD